MPGPPAGKDPTRPVLTRCEPITGNEERCEEMNKQEQSPPGGVATTQYRVEGDHIVRRRGISRALWPIVGLVLAVAVLALAVFIA